VYLVDAEDRIHLGDRPIRSSGIQRQGRQNGADQWTGRMFFSEEKNQKTFISALAQPVRPWPVSLEAAEN
jgi:hypothetical protein